MTVPGVDLAELPLANEADPTVTEETRNIGGPFWDVLDGAAIKVVIGAGETEVVHGLGRVPNGFFVLGKSKQGLIIEAREEAWTTEIFYLRSTVSNQEVRLFVV